MRRACLALLLLGLSPAVSAYAQGFRQEVLKDINANVGDQNFEYYTAPYVGNKKIYKRVPRERMTYFGWEGLFAGVTEGICAPMNEVEGYNKGFRDPGQARTP
jgi:hypothetical protein